MKATETAPKGEANPEGRSWTEGGGDQQAPNAQVGLRGKQRYPSRRWEKTAAPNRLMRESAIAGLHRPAPRLAGC